MEARRHNVPVCDFFDGLQKRIVIPSAARNPGNANLPIGAFADAIQENGVPGRHEEAFLATLGMTAFETSEYFNR